MHDLYENLMDLCASQATDAFYCVDQEFGGRKYRIFLYRIASYSDFCLPGALECRGHTFDITAAPELVSRPMQKFFNLSENPFTIDLPLNSISNIADKLDGSLISTVRTTAGFTLKTKGSFFSEQSQKARDLILSPAYAGLNTFCKEMASSGFTVNMEFVGPCNRIVLPYSEKALKILNVRENATGRYLSSRDLPPNIHHLTAKTHEIPSDGHSWVEKARNLTGIEGFVVTLADGTIFKLKTHEYCALHKTRSQLNSPKYLFEVCVHGGADDLKSLFADRPEDVKIIDDMAALVAGVYNSLHREVSAFYEENKHLERKDYAIKAQKELSDSSSFPIVMAAYGGKEPDITSFMLKNYKRYVAEQPEA